MPEVQDTQIHLSCQHFRCDSLRLDKQKRRLVLPFSSTRQTSTAGCPHCKGNVHIHDHGVTVWHDPDPRGALPPLPLPALSEKVPPTYPETRIPHRADAWVKGLMRWQMPASMVQKITGIHGDTIRSIHKQTMDEALVRRWLQISGPPVWRWTGSRSTRGTAMRPA